MSNEMTLSLRIKANADGSLSILSDTEQKIAKLETASDRSSAGMERLSKSIMQVGHYAAALASATFGGYMIKDAVALADKMTLLDSRVAIATKSIHDHASAMGALKQISLDTGTSLESNMTLFARLNKSIESTGRSYQDTLALTKTLSQAITISGASAGEASSLMIQLSQAFSSGVLRGDEFNSVMENGARVVDALTTATGKSRGELRKMAEDGQLSSDVVIKALQSQAAAIEADAQKIPLTVGRAVENLNTQWSSWLDTLNRSAGATSGLADALGALAEHFVAVANAVVTAVAALLSYQAAVSVQSLAAYVATQYQMAAALKAASLAAVQGAAERTAADLAAAQANVALLQSNRALVAEDIAAANAALQSANARLSQAAANRTAAVATANLSQATLALAAAETARAEKAAALASLAALGQQQAGIARNLAAATVAQTTATTAAAAAQSSLSASTSITAKAMAGLRAALTFLAGINPFTAIVTAIGAAATAAWLYRGSLVNVADATVSVGNLIESAWLLIKRAGQDAIDGISAQFPALTSAVSTAAGFIGEAFQSAWNAIKTGAQWLFNVIVGGFVAVGSAIGTAAAGVVEVWRQSFKRIMDMASGLALGIDAAMAGDLSFSGFREAFSRETLSMQHIARDTGAKIKAAFAADYAGVAGNALAEFGGTVKEGAKDLQMLDTMMASNAARAETLSQAAGKAGAVIETAGGKASKAADQAANAYAKQRAAVAETLAEIERETAMIGLSNTARERANALQRATANATAEEREQIEAALKTQWAKIDALEKETAAMEEAADAAKRYADEYLRLYQKFNPGEAKLDADLKDVWSASDMGLLDSNRLRDELEAVYKDAAGKGAAATNKAFDRAIENIEDGFADMFESMLNGDAMGSFSRFADNIKNTLIKALSNAMSSSLMNIFSGKGGSGDWTGLIFGVVGSVAAYAVNYLTSGKIGAPKAPTQSPTAQYGDSRALGFNAMVGADTYVRNAYYSAELAAFKEQLTTQQNIISVLTSTGVISLQKIKALGLEFSKELAGLVTDVTGELGGAGQAIQDFTVSAKAQALIGVLSAAYEIYGLVQNWDDLSTFNKITATISAVTSAASAAVQVAVAAGSSAAQSISSVVPVIGWIVAALINVAQTAKKLSDGDLAGGFDQLATGGYGKMLENWTGINNEQNMITLLTAGGDFILSKMAGFSLVDFMKPRVPNAWMNTYNPAYNGQAYQYNPNVPTYTADVKKSAYVGEMTPFGMTVMSTHEANLSISQMVDAFGLLLKTVKTVDIALYDSINRLDAQFGETGQTMAHYNDVLRSYSAGNDVRVASKQELSDVNVAPMLKTRYDWIVNVLEQSGSKVGQALGDWYALFADKFGPESTLSIVNALSSSLDALMQLPANLIGLIDKNVKSFKHGGTPETAATEISGILDAYMQGLVGLTLLGADVDDRKLVDFLAQVNAVGFGVKEASGNLLAYAGVLRTMGTDMAAMGNQLLDQVLNKFKSLQASGFDNEQLTAYFATFGLFAKVFQKAQVSFNEANLDSVAVYVSDLAKASAQAAKDTIDQAIAAENLGAKSRDAAIAILVKTQKIDEATVAEAEYGTAITQHTQALLDAMGFIQQVGYVSGQALGQMGVSANTWIAAAKNIVTIFGDLEKATAAWDGIVKAFLSDEDYAAYNMATLNRALADMAAISPALADLNQQSVLAMLKSGDSMAGFIGQMAQGDGEMAKQTVAYLQLLAQKLAMEKQQAEQLQALLSGLYRASVQYDDIADQLLAKYSELISKAQALGANPTQIGQIYGALLAEASDSIDSALGELAKSFLQFSRNLQSARASIADNINQLGGSASIDNAAFQQDMIDQLYAQLATSSDRDEQLAIINDINQAVMDRYDAELGLLSKIGDATKQIRGYLDNLLLSDKSPLTNMQQLSEARAQYGTQLAAAKAGDKDALAGLTQAADAYLSQARTTYASGADYTAVFNSVRSALEQLAIPQGMDEATYKANMLALQDKAITELTSLDGRLQAISEREQTANDVRHDQLMGALQRIQDAVSVSLGGQSLPAPAVTAWQVGDGLPAANAGPSAQTAVAPLLPTQPAPVAGTSAWYVGTQPPAAPAVTTIAGLDKIDVTVREVFDNAQKQAAALHQEILDALTRIETAVNRAIDGSTVPMSQVLNWVWAQQGGQTVPGSAPSLGGPIAAPLEAYLRDVSKYAVPLNGSHADGLHFVPFDGYRAELHKGERVLTASQARAQDNSNGSDMAAELRALRAELAQLRAEQREQTDALIRSNYDANERAAETVGERVEKSVDKQRWASNKVAVA